MYNLHCDRNKCYFCGIKNPPRTKGKKYRSLIEVHHIIEQNNGGSNSKMNLVSVCSNCHSKVHLDMIQIDKWYNLLWCFKLKWIDEHGNEHFGPYEG